MSEAILTNASQGCKVCDHVKDNGVVCNQPAISGERYCRFHVRVRTTTSPEDQMYELPILETEQSVQIALQHVTRGILSGNLSERKAKVVMSAIKAAAQLIRQANSNRTKEDLLHEIAHELRGRAASHKPAEPEAQPRTI